MARFQLHLRAGFGLTRGSFLGRFSVFFFYVPVAGGISSSLKYSIDDNNNFRNWKISLVDSLITVWLTPLVDSLQLGD